MKKTNKELAEFYGIEVGDTVKIYDPSGELYGEFLVKDLDAMCPLQVIECREHLVCAVKLTLIGTQYYEVIKPKKKVGETRCSDYMFCNECPLYLLRCDADGFGGKTIKWPLYKILNETCRVDDGMKSDNPIYLAFRAELDKEVDHRA